MEISDTFRPSDIHEALLFAILCELRALNEANKLLSSPAEPRRDTPPVPRAPSALPVPQKTTHGKK